MLRPALPPPVVLVVPTDAELPALPPPPTLPPPPPAESVSLPPPEHAAKITAKAARDRIDVTWVVPAWQTFEVVMCPFGVRPERVRTG